jgi:hypothetical protein
MAIRAKMRANAAPLLQEGEQIQQVFGAQPVSPYLALISLWILLIKNTYRVVVVTDRRILVCRAGRFSRTPVKELLRELPRLTKIGPARGVWFRSDSLGEKLYIHKRFHNDVASADAEMPAPPFV